MPGYNVFDGQMIPEVSIKTVCWSFCAKCTQFKKLITLWEKGESLFFGANIYFSSVTHQTTFLIIGTVKYKDRMGVGPSVRASVYLAGPILIRPFVHSAFWSFGHSVF